MTLLSDLAAGEYNVSIHHMSAGGISLVQISGYVSLAASMATFLTGLVTLISIYRSTRRKGEGKHEKPFTDSD